MGAGSKLRQLFAEDGSFVVPGVPNALTARIAEEMGFRAVLFTGAGFANLEFGVPDLGLTTMTEVIEQVGRITEAVDIAVLADADTGYGNFINVRRTVRELERAGAAAIVLEDQTFPKRCGHFDGRRVIEVDEMIAKIKSAVDSRRNPETVIIARTDARELLGLKEAISRARAYMDAGADAIVVEAPLSIEELAEIGAISAPKYVHMVEGGRTPVLPAKQLAAMGFKLIVYPNTALRAAIRGMQNVLAVLANEGITSNVLDQISTWEERQRLVRLHEYDELEIRYASREQAKGTR